MSENKKVLLTGINGQTASFLAESLLEKGYEVHGIIRRSSNFNTGRIDHLFKYLHIKYGDLADYGNIDRIIREVWPAEIYNLGAMSHVAVSAEIPEYTSDVTGLGAVRILESIKNFDRSIRYYQASSSEMFGGIEEEMPLTGYTEESRFHPRSIYGCAKLFAHWSTINYRESYNMYACNGLCFNNESERRGETFVTRKITKWFGNNYKSLLKKESVTPLELGNLYAKRDWSYSKDVVEAMWLMMQQDKPEDYIIASGTTHSIKDFINACCEDLGFSLKWEGVGLNEKGIINGLEAIKINPRYFRAAEVDVLLGDASRIKNKLGWKPTTSFKELVHIMINNDVFRNEMDK